MLGIEARGFIFGPALAYRLNAGFVPVRKPRKLPAPVARVTYDLEYGSDTLEIHMDAIQPGQSVVLVDDLLATGGTMEATVKLVKQLGGRDRRAGLCRGARLPERPRALHGVRRLQPAALRRVVQLIQPVRVLRRDLGLGSKLAQNPSCGPSLRRRRPRSRSWNICASAKR